MTGTVLCVLLAVAATASGEDSFAREMLDAHNAIRAAVKVAPLVWSERLADSAREWASTLIAKRQFMHRPKSKFGENLFLLDGGGTTPEKVVARWAAESANFDYKSNHCRGACGHYTQIVWSDTRELGCAVARGGGREVWVCEYNPPGNYIGRRPY